MDRSSRQKKKINKATVTLNDTLDQMDLIDICKTSHPEAAAYTFCSYMSQIYMEHSQR